MDVFSGDLAAQAVWKISAPPDQENTGSKMNDEDGTLLVASQCSLRFGRDHRFKEVLSCESGLKPSFRPFADAPQVRRLLRSNRQMCLRMPEWHELADRDVIQVCASSTLPAPDELSFRPSKCVCSSSLVGLYLSALAEECSPFLRAVQYLLRPFLFLRSL
jgi:hypothetical protein